MKISTTGHKVTVVKPDVPAPCIQAGGINGGNTSQYYIADELGGGAVTDKPPYRVPSMAEVQALPWNGLKVASTFSGCGGSCLGYRMAGFKVIWANEFVPSAQASYKANADPASVLDGRDIRTVQPEDILSATGLAVGDLDLFDGSPPCQAFSTAGKREKGWGREKVYEHGAHQKNETLFAEYVRLLRGLKPKVFIAENVSGLVKGTCKGMFLNILADLKASGYRVEARLLDAQWLGVPQTRKRVIFQGIREDIGKAPAFPKPLPYRYSVRDALPWIGRVVQDPQGQFAVQVNNGTTPLFSVKAGSAHHVKVEQETDISRFAIGREWDDLKPGEKSGKYCYLIRADADRPSPTICAVHGNLSTAGVTHPSERRKFTIAELRRICGFPDDFILTGSYAQQWKCLGNSVPPVMMYHIAKAVCEGPLTSICWRS